MATQTRIKASGLQWLASRDPERWMRPTTGKPCIAWIARDAEINRTNLHEMIRGTRALNMETHDRLRDLAVSTGASHDRAQDELFEPVEISTERAAA